MTADSNGVMPENREGCKPVWCLVEGNWQDYEGGGDAILGIFSTEQKALDALSHILRAADAEMVTADSDGCYRLAGSPSNRWLQIQTWFLDGLP